VPIILTNLLNLILISKINVLLTVINVQLSWQVKDFKSERSRVRDIKLVIIDW
jgi:hypothetical protein